MSEATQAAMRARQRARMIRKGLIVETPPEPPKKAEKAKKEEPVVEVPAEEAAQDFAGEATVLEIE